jgi:hypothetical protein
MADPYTLVVTTEYYAVGWWLVIKDPAVRADKQVFSIPLNGHPDNEVVLYPLLGVGFAETEQIAPRRITDRVVLQTVQYALDQAIYRREPLSESALNLLNWVSELPTLRTT